MKLEKIARILDNHSVPYYTESGRIYADCMMAGTALFEEVADLTDCTPEALRIWLGY